MQETATVQLADDDRDTVVCFCLFFQLAEAHVATVGKRQISTACQMQVDQVSEKKAVCERSATYQFVDVIYLRLIKQS